MSIRRIKAPRKKLRCQTKEQPEVDYIRDAIDSINRQQSEDTLKFLWDEHRKFLEEEGMPPPGIDVSRIAFEVGAEAYLLAIEDERWRDFREACKKTGCEDKWIEWFEDAFKWGVDSQQMAQWIPTASNEELREHKAQLQREMRQMMQ